MNNALLHHAIDNVWCSPGQDRQYVWKLVNLSPTLSIRNVYLDFYERIPLPTKNDYYHIYQIGKMHPGTLGIPKRTRTWMSLSYLMKTHLLFSDVYTSSGIQFPRGDAWVWFTPTGNMLVAVKENRRIQSLYGQDLFLRVYSNAFFDSPRANGRREIIHKQITVTDRDQLLFFQRELADIVDEKGGFPFYFVNGRFVKNISLVTAGENDVCEFILDRSIKKMVEFNANELPVFLSKKDRMNKYLLHYNANGEEAVIDYADDIDGYLIDPKIGERFMGVHYHKNRKEWLRMLTHKDYSIPVSRLVEFVNVHPTDPRHQVDPARWPEDKWSDVTTKRLRLYIRDSGYHRPLTTVAPRIQELYRLDDQQIVRAMLEIDGTVDVWKAENLEMSDYVTLMGMKQDLLITTAYNDPDVPTTKKQELEDLVGNAYGYHAAASILADTPTKVYVDSGVKYADLAYEHQNTSTVFEYDVNGLLIDWYYHSSGTRWEVKNESCVLVEALAGRGHFRARTYEGTNDVYIPEGFNFRVYVKDKEFDTPLGEWKDVTFAADVADWGFHDKENNLWRWKKAPSQFLGAVRIDNEFLCYEFPLIKSDGHLRFTVEREIINNDGYWGSVTVDIPYGQLDVFLNGRQLAETIDYQVHWPEIVINNLEYLKEEDTQTVLVRLSGFAESPTERQSLTEVGFIRRGVLSRNDSYDIHTSKVKRIVADGRMFHRDDVVFDEQVSNFTIDSVKNGKPYFIQTPSVVFREVFENDKAARLKDDEIHRQVSNYMTEHFGLKQYDDPNMIERKYQVISVFTNKLLHDLKMGWFYPDGIEGNYGQHDIRQWCKNYEWLVKYDIANTDYDTFHLNVRPHWHERPVDIDLFKYRFLHRALETYLRHPPDLSIYVTIS